MASPLNPVDHTVFEDWETKKNVLAIFAHPDDPEYFCGATVAKWTSNGHNVRYSMLTCGDKGTRDRSLSSESLCALRRQEQRTAAAVLGVETVSFLNYPDGYLVPDIHLRHDITREIRRVKPDVIVTCDPQTLFFDSERINHPDHRAAGQAVIDAVFPAARDHLYFVDLIEEEGLEPHKVQEVWIAGTLHPNLVVDVTAYWETKIAAISKHTSQIDDIGLLTEKMRRRLAQGADFEHPRYEEKYFRITLH